MWRNASITFKILAAGGILVLGYCISMIIGFYIGMQTEKNLIYASKVIFPASQQSQLALNAFEEQVKLYKDAVVLGDAAALEKAQAKADVVSKSLSYMISKLNEDDKHVASLKDTSARHGAFTASAKAVYSAMSSGGGAGGDDLMNKAAALNKQTQEITALLQRFANDFSKSLQDNLGNLENQSRNQRYSSLGTFFVVVIIAVTLVLIIVVGSVRKPIRETVSILRDIAEGEGDLTKRLNVRGMDEVGELATWFNQFIENLSDIITQIKETALEMDESIQVVASESMGLSQSTQEQAAAVEEVASTIHQITSSIKMNAQASSTGLTVTNDIVAKVASSAQMSQELIISMKEISESSHKIGDIIRTVNEVAFQTNLLALNAAVEAARAGEHGKGFSVVAEEVRALAQRSSDAARQIKGLIEDTVAKIASQDKMVNKSGAALNEIRESIESLTQAMHEISATSNEQAEGVDNVNRAVVEIDNVTQKNASTVQQMASMAEKLSMEANTLAETVGKFKVD